MNKYKPALPLLPIAGFLWDGIKQMIMWRILFIILAIINMLLNIAELIINGFNSINFNAACGWFYACLFSIMLYYSEKSGRNGE